MGDTAARNFPIGGGQMGRRIRDFSWETTALGPIDAWSPALRAIVQMMVAQKQAICMYWGPDLALVYNDSYAKFLGAKEPTALGQPFHVVWSDVWDGVKPFVDQALSGEGTWSEDFPLVMTRNGYPEETFWTFSYSPLYEDGRINGILNIALDTTPAVFSRRQEQALQRELMHRTKNNLAVTAAVVSSTLRHATNIDQARAIVAARIAALGKAQEMLRFDGSDASIREVVTVALQAHVDRPDRMSIDGEDIRVASQRAVGLSLAIYELATNAVKYGSLSTPAGRVSVAWTLDQDGRFEFVWRESDGPEVSAPTHDGFGSRLTNSVVPTYFAGKAETQYGPDGVVYRLTGTL
jgi:two-component sensor histidine kinase